MIEPLPALAFRKTKNPDADESKAVDSRKLSNMLSSKAIDNFENLESPTSKGFWQRKKRLSAGEPTSSMSGNTLNSDEFDFNDGTAATSVSIQDHITKNDDDIPKTQATAMFPEDKIVENNNTVKGASDFNIGVMSPNIKSQVGSSALSSTKPQAGEGFPSELHQQGLPESVEVSNSNYTELPNLNPIHTSLNGSKQWHDVNDNIAPLKNTGFPSSTTSEFDNEPLFVPETSTKSTQSSAMKKIGYHNNDSTGAFSIKNRPTNSDNISSTSTNSQKALCPAGSEEEFKETRNLHEMLKILHSLSLSPYQSNDSLNIQNNDNVSQETEGQNRNLRFENAQSLPQNQVTQKNNDHVGSSSAINDVDKNHVLKKDETTERPEPKNNNSQSLANGCNGKTNSNNTNSSFRFTKKLKQVRYGHNYQKDLQKTTSGVDSKTSAFESDINKHVKSKPEPILIPKLDNGSHDNLNCEITHPSSSEAISSLLPNPSQNGLDSPTNYDEESATATSHHDKGKTKRSFFNTSMFRTSGRHNSFDISNNVDQFENSNTNNAESPNFIDTFPNDSKANVTNSLEPSAINPSHDTPRLFSNKNRLRKTRSKSDVGIYGPIDIRSAFRFKSDRLNNIHNNATSVFGRAQDDSVLPDHIDQNNHPFLARNYDSEDENAIGRDGTTGKKKRNFLPRHMSITPTFPNFPTFSSSFSHNTSTDPTAANNDVDGEAEIHEPIRRHTIFSMDYNPASRSMAIKNAFKRFKKKRPEKQEEEPTDEPSELIAELTAGIPAAMLIPMSLLKDERNIQRIPVLLQHLKLSFTDITRNLNEKNRKYQIDLKYGSGSASLEWSIIRDYKDLMTLHSRLKVLAFQNIAAGPKLQLPKFPSRHRIAANLIKENSDGTGESPTQKEPHNNSRTGSLLTPVHSSSNPVTTANNDYVATNSGGVSSRHNLSSQNMLQPRTQLSTILDDPNERASFQSDRSASTMSISSQGSVRSFAFFSRMRPSVSNRAAAVATVGTSFIASGHFHVGDAEKERFCEALRQALEKYLLDLFSALRFRPEVNRIFQFLELSNMSMRLAPESSYHGKEGYLILRSSAASMGWRVSHWKPNELSLMVDRHTSRWYLVRESYIVCVNDISGVNVSEVFMVDSFFKVTHGLVTGGGAGALAHQSNELTVAKSNTNNNANKQGVADISEIDSHQGFTFEVANGERKMKLLTTSQRQLGLWIESINHMTENTVWSQPHRFQSFAPVRQNVQARWFVDARDYFWTVSAAIDMAKDVIYIHDWWLSPELYLRRPADGNQEWRIDRLLRRKAEQGVKIFIIVYRNVGQTVPIDSSWTKHSLLDLHPNIYLMRSPNQLLQNTYFWAHHEKLCLVDHTIGFLGGIDLCYGRWDTSEHVLVDDSPVAFTDPSDRKEMGPTQIWPGKDYSNPRQRDFFNLDKPYEDMYDRNEVCRMPWHDVHMMVTGQPARDLVRHFVQRWNYLIRQKRPSRFTPLLLPPSDLTPEQIKSLNLEGTCEVQLLRSSCSWSLGIKKPETSIQNAYLKAIDNSKNFVYIENQFFISSTFYEGTEIENKIGDALVRRIVRAHRNKEQWKCVVVIPLMPGFESEIDEKNGLSVRMIMQLQYLTISHGPNSIFGKLFQHNINPEDYIQFFSLRKWGKIGPDKKLVSEQLYIHCKTMIVDDVVAIIGSANINERSMRGTRDSEVASIIRDTEQIDSQMAGKKVKVGKFPHTLRMRLMREHVGINIDQLDMIENLVDREISKLLDAAKEKKIAEDLGIDVADLKVAEAEVENIPIHEFYVNESVIHSSNTLNNNKTTGEAENNRIERAHAPRVSGQSEFDNQRVELHSFNHLAGEENIGFRDKKPISSDSRVQGNQTHKNDVDGLGFDQFRRREAMDHVNGGLMTVMPPTGAESVEQYAHNYLDQIIQDEGLDYAIKNLRDIKRRIYYYLQTRDWRKDTPSHDNISKDANGGKIIPMEFFPNKADADDNIFQFQDIGESNSGLHSSHGTTSSFSADASGSGVGTSSNPDLPQQKFAPIDPYAFEDPVCPGFYYDMWERVADQNTLLFREVFHCQPDDEVTTWQQYIDFKELFSRFAHNQNQQLPRDEFEINIPAEQRKEYERDVGIEQGTAPEIFESSRPKGTSSSTPSNDPTNTGLPATDFEANRQARLEQAKLERELYETMLRRRRQNKRSSRNAITADDVYQPEVAQRVLEGVRGNLVFFPTQWLAHELDSGNWQHAIDHLPPIEIYV